MLLRQKANQVTRKRGLNYLDTDALSTDEIVSDSSKVFSHLSNLSGRLCEVILLGIISAIDEIIGNDDPSQTVEECVHDIVASTHAFLAFMQVISSKNLSDPGEKLIKSINEMLNVSILKVEIDDKVISAATGMNLSLVEQR